MTPIDQAVERIPHFTPEEIDLICYSLWLAAGCLDQKWIDKAKVISGSPDDFSSRIKAMNKDSVIETLNDCFKPIGSNEISMMAYKEYPLSNPSKVTERDSNVKGIKAAASRNLRVQLEGVERYSPFVRHVDGLDFKVYCQADLNGEYVKLSDIQKIVGE